MGARRVDTAELARAMEAGKVPILVDVRTGFEFAGGHVPGAQSIPLSEIKGHVDSLRKHKEVWLICASGARSASAAATLSSSGVKVVDVIGGMGRWSGAVDPPASPRKLLMPLVASLSLGLAPFLPEPHLVGKLRWVVGGAAGMQPADWFDLAMHGAPWVWLAWSAIRLVTQRR